MFHIKALNQISAKGLAHFPQERFQITDEIDRADAILLRSANMHDITIPKNLLTIGRAGAGTNNIPVSRMSQHGVVVFNAPGANANAVKELVLGGMLLAARNICDAWSFTQTLHHRADAEQMMECEKKRFVGTELNGKSIGVVGLGAIGVKVANAAHALGMRVYGFDPHMTVDGAWQLSSEIIKATSLHALYNVCDYVSFHVPLMEATKGLLDDDSLSALKSGMVVLNFARDGIVDSAALKKGLESGQIARYVTDFPKAENLHDPRIIALPHLGASTQEAEENCAVMVVEQVRDYLENGNINNAVNFPNIRMSRMGVSRLCVANRNVPNMIGKLSQVLGQENMNIAQMHNASRSDLAYNLVDVDGLISNDLLQNLRAIDGILAVRAITEVDA